MSTLTDIKVPDIGDFSDVPIIEIYVKPGDAVAVDDALVTLESDKATMDVPASTAGV
ncbi:MAG: dihydrolipoamide acetyltransferase, partial [Azoarcus sp.]|nr:dihydrolipoamide acetyltransferase [Azoarcus sp.]